MKYPIGIQTFEDIRRNGYVYVDKTDLVYALATEGKTYFLSRPRRFGKSLLVSTLESYFLGKKELFDGLKIAALEKHWTAYPVFRLDFSGQNYTGENALPEILETFVADAEEHFGRSQNATSLGSRFMWVLQKAHLQTGQPAVVLVDEYDKPLLDVMGLPYEVEYLGRKLTLEEKNRELLKAFYSVFKAADADLRFVFLTGVTKFSQVSVFSGFNQPDDISMSRMFDTLCGITNAELEHYFHEPIQALALDQHVSYEEMKAQLRTQYDGYHFSKMMVDIYNPFSLLNCFKHLSLDNYWFQTGTPTYLVRLLEHFDENINELACQYYVEDEFANYNADTERPLPMIYQSGYFTIKDYKPRTQTYLLDFPNDEVKRGFVSLLASAYLKPRRSADNLITRAVEMLDEGHIDEFGKSLTAFLSSIPYSTHLKTDTERHFHYTFYLLLRLLSTYMVYTEKQQSQGRVDCIVESEHYVYIFEFKLDGTAADALHQIEQKGYAREYAADPRSVCRIGCSFSSKTGTVGDWKSQW